MPNFSIIIPTVRSKTVVATVRSILHQTVGDFELIIVGQGEFDQTEQVVTQAGITDPRICYIHLPVCGLSRARNAGIQGSNGDVLVFIDDDCEADPNLLLVYQTFFAAHPDCELIGGALIKPPKPPMKLGVCPFLNPKEVIYDSQLNPRHPPAGWDWIGANFAVRRSVFQSNGFFDECLGAGTKFPAGEDTDFKLRLENNGVIMGSTPRAIVHHTYGYRTGLKAVLKIRSGYNYGNGALAAKLTMMQDARGKEWINTIIKGCLHNSLRQPHHIPQHTLTIWNMLRGYYHCQANYIVKDAILWPKT